MSPHHRITALVSHLPCPLPPSQSVICLAPCHQTSQSFTLRPTTESPRQSVICRATKPVSHLPCPLPPNQSVICLAPYHRVTASPHHHTTTSPHHCVTTSLCHHRVTVSPRHCINQSFVLPPATKPVSHLPCPLPPNQSVICLAPCHQASQSPPHHCIRVTALVSHLPCPLPPSQSVICLAPCHQTSQSSPLATHITCITAHHRITASLPQSFALPPATKPHGS